MSNGADETTIKTKSFPSISNIPDKKVHGYLLGYGGTGLAGIATFLYMWGGDVKEKIASMYNRQEKMVELQIQTNQKLDKLIDLQQEHVRKLDDLVKATYRNNRR